MEVYGGGSFVVFGPVCGLLNCICDTVGGVGAVDVKF